MDKTQSRNQDFFDSEIEKLENWAADLKDGLELELRELQREITSLNREARRAADLQSKLEIHRKISELWKKRNERRKGIYEAQHQERTALHDPLAS